MAGEQVGAIPPPYISKEGSTVCNRTLGVPMAALHIDECNFSQLTASDWSQILVLRPDLVGKFESIERDWSKDDETDDIEEILQDSL